jgi:hypothetical protein
MDIEAPFMSAEASVPLPAANGSGSNPTEHDSDDDDGRSDGSVSPPATAKSRCVFQKGGLSVALHNLLRQSGSSCIYSQTSSSGSWSEPLRLHIIA